MRRAVAGSVATVAFLVVMLSLKSSDAGPRKALAAPATTHAPARAGAPRHSAASGTFTGAVESTPYGPVQVRVTVASGRITDVTAVQLPHAASYSRDLASMAAPQLRQETLQQQSARIDVVSGATYTSEGYAQSLQAALDRIGR